jgi:hypothetical protein
MLETILIATVPTVIMSGAAAWITSLLQRKKYLAETMGVEQKNLQTKMATYETFLNDTSDRVNRMTSEFRAREEEFLKRETMYLKRINDNEQMINSLKKDIDELTLVMTKLNHRICDAENCPNRICTSIKSTITK